MTDYKCWNCGGDVREGTHLVEEEFADRYPSWVCVPPVVAVPTVVPRPGANDE
jgi:hypothetical protein